MAARPAVVAEAAMKVGTFVDLGVGIYRKEVLLKLV